MPRDKRKKIADEGDIKIGGSAVFSVSLGEATGLAKPSQAASDSVGKKLEKPDATPKNADPDAYLKAVSQATLHRESSGRGGRIVTVVTLKPVPDSTTAEAVSKAMKRGLGCGSHVEGIKIVLQGDIKDRAAQWLEKKSAAKIAMGN